LPHKWTRNDDLIAFYVDKFGIDKLPNKPSEAEIAASLGIEPGSFKMRIQNFRALAGKGGLEHFARQSKDVFEEYNSLSEPELRRKAFPEL
jgi:hypothetical protein